jgi:fatty acid desaturase
MGQYATLVGVQVGLLALAVVVAFLRPHESAVGAALRGLEVWFFGFGLSAMFANWSMIFINYIQHVHTDPWSEHNHSRNFVGKLGNWLVFNNGFHTAHHESAGLHWSKLPEAHAKIAHLIAPELKQPSIITYCLRSYLLGVFSDRFRTHEIGRPAYEPPDGGDVKLVTASVTAVEAGVNASMA